ncbi:MAG TPA: hypothetical protein PLM07_15310 [Candidatus Rifleibacterium sp.]|nr:hypothetical protein [Candidatus Rifleibacterium sp.]
MRAWREIQDGLGAKICADISFIILVLLLELIAVRVAFIARWGGTGTGFTRASIGPGLDDTVCQVCRDQHLGGFLLAAVVMIAGW